MVGALVVSSGLIMPAWAIVALAVVWVGGLVVAYRNRRQPGIVLAVPFITAAIWFVTGVAGEALLGWKG